MTGTAGIDAHLFQQAGAIVLQVIGHGGADPRVVLVVIDPFDLCIVTIDIEAAGVDTDRADADADLFFIEEGGVRGGGA